jgi:hypothetical protein
MKTQPEQLKGLPFKLLQSPQKVYKVPTPELYVHEGPQKKLSTN